MNIKSCLSYIKNINAPRVGVANRLTLPGYAGHGVKSGFSDAMRVFSERSLLDRRVSDVVGFCSENRGTLAQGGFMLAATLAAHMGLDFVAGPFGEVAITLLTVLIANSAVSKTAPDTKAVALAGELDTPCITKGDILKLVVNFGLPAVISKFKGYQAAKREDALARETYAYKLTGMKPKQLNERYVEPVTTAATNAINYLRSMVTFCASTIYRNVGSLFPSIV